MGRGDGRKMAGEEDQPPVWIEERPRRRRLYASRRARICSYVLPLQKGAWVEYEKPTGSFCKIETFSSEPLKKGAWGQYPQQQGLFCKNSATVNP